MNRRALQVLASLVAVSLLTVSIAAAYYFGYTSATKEALRSNATSDLYTYVTLAREIDHRQVELQPEVSRLLANRLLGAELACSTVLGLQLVEQPQQQANLQELMEEAKGLQAKLRPSFE